MYIFGITSNENRFYYDIYDISRIVQPNVTNLGYEKTQEMNKLAITDFYIIFDFGTKYIWNHLVNTFQISICFAMISMTFLVWSGQM